MITINDLPSEILDEIFLQVGRRSHEELNNIRRVSRTWDERIKIKLRAVNPSEEWGRIIGSRIKKRFTLPSQPEIARAASMAHLGHLGTLRNMFLYDVDLSSIPAGHLSSLASCVTGRVSIINDVSGLSPLLSSLQCERLCISSKQTLNTEETEAMVRAMERGVERVTLGYLGGGITTMDIRAFTSYNGAGKCSRVDCRGDKAGRYKKDLVTWAQRNNWNVTVDSLLVIVCKRYPEIL